MPRPRHFAALRKSWNRVRTFEAQDGEGAASTMRLDHKFRPDERVSEPEADHRAPGRGVTIAVVLAALIWAAVAAVWLCLR